MNKYINEVIKNTLTNIEDISIEYEIPSKSNTGHFTIHPRKAVEVWNQRDFKRITEIISACNDSYNIALKFHNIFMSLVMELTTKKESLDSNFFIRDRKAIDDYIKRLIKFNDMLIDFGIESIEAETAPVYKKCTVYSHHYENHEHIIKVHDGYQFNYSGYTLQCYGNGGVNFVIVPSCGIGTPPYDTNLKTGHEYLKELINYLNNPAKRKTLIKVENDFIDLMIKAGYTPNDIHKSIFDRPSIDVVAGAIEASETINHSHTKARVHDVVAV